MLPVPSGIVLAVTTTKVTKENIAIQITVYTITLFILCYSKF